MSRTLPLEGDRPARADRLGRTGSCLPTGLGWCGWVVVAAGACAGPSPAPTAGDAVGLTELAANPGKADGAGAADPGAATDGGTRGKAGDIAAVACVAPGAGACDSTAECATGEYCDPCLRTCAPARDVCQPCTADIQCKNAIVDGKPASVCLGYATGGNFCGGACLSDAGCPQGYTCESLPGIAAKQCVPKSKSCAPGSGACKSDSDCPFTTVCNGAYGVCVKGCTGDTGCAAGKVCALGHCTDPCQGDADCAKIAAKAVCVDKKCKIPGGCMGSDECEAPQTHCDVATHLCAPGCVIDSDCKDFGKKCQAAVCVAKGCEANYQCAFGQICDVATGACKKAGGLFCAPCDPKDADAKACGGKPNACLQFKDANDQDKGAFCGIACGSDPGGPCPQGWQCTELKDDKGNSQGKLCLRPCYNTPVAPPGGSGP